MYTDDDAVLRMWRRGGLNREMHSPYAGEGLRNEEYYEAFKKYNPDRIPKPTEREFYFSYRSLYRKS